MKTYKPKHGAVQAVRVRRDLTVPAGHYLIIKDGNVSTMTPELFAAVYSVCEKSKKHFNEADNQTRRERIFEALSASGKWLTAKELCALLPADCHTRISGNLNDLVRAGRVAVVRDLKPWRYTSRERANGKS